MLQKRSLFTEQPVAVVLWCIPPRRANVYTTAATLRSTERAAAGLWAERQLSTRATWRRVRAFAERSEGAGSESNRIVRAEGLSRPIDNPNTQGFSQLFSSSPFFGSVKSVFSRLLSARGSQTATQLYAESEY
jgi:hypothetical protein